MAKGIGKGNAEGSQRILDEKRGGTQFTTETGREAGVRSGEERRRKAEQERKLDDNLSEALDSLDADMPQEEYRKLTIGGHNHIQRIFAREFNDPKRAFPALQWLYDRVKGKPTQVVDNNITGDLEVSKPPIVFKDVESASREGEEERLHSEEEDI